MYDVLPQGLKGSDEDVDEKMKGKWMKNEFLLEFEDFVEDNGYKFNDY